MMSDDYDLEKQLHFNNREEPIFVSETSPINGMQADWNCNSKCCCLEAVIGKLRFVMFC